MLAKFGVQTYRLGLAHEYDPYFSLSIARVDPLPHQLEAVYDNFLALPRIRFLLADDPGAGKTIMAGPDGAELRPKDLLLDHVRATAKPEDLKMFCDLLKSALKAMGAGK